MDRRKEILLKSLLLGSLFIKANLDERIVSSSLILVTQFVCGGDGMSAVALLNEKLS
jgi:hypothetical protein